MANVLDFNKVKKQYLTVKFRDEDQTTLLVCTPSKALFADILATGGELSNVDADALTEAEAGDVLAQAYEICAKAISNNKTRKKITAEELANILDFEDMLTFFNAYVQFVNSLADQKN